MATYTNKITDRCVIAGTTSAINLNKFLAVSSRMVIGQTVRQTYVAKLSAIAGLRFTPSIAPVNGLYHHVVAAPLRLAGSAIGLTKLVLTSRLQFAEATRLRIALKMLDTISARDAITTQASLLQPATDRLGLRDAASQGWFRSTLSRLVLAPLASARLKVRATLAEIMVLDASVQSTLLVKLLHADTLDLSDLADPSALFFDHVTELLDLTVRLRSPDGSFTAWSINTRTAAVTEYQNFVFTSFVQMPNGVVLASGRDGALYELNGNDDDGSPIIAAMAGGALDIGGSAFTQLKAAYLGVRGQGTYYLKLTTQNDVTRLYEVKARPMQTARIDIGKGLRSRYIQWELISTGQDFDLTGIEFLPLVSTRRI